MMSNTLTQAVKIANLSELVPLDIDLDAEGVEVVTTTSTAPEGPPANEYAELAGASVREVAKFKKECGEKVLVTDIWKRIAVEAKGVTKCECVARSERRTFSVKPKKCETMMVKGKHYPLLDNRWNLTVAPCPAYTTMIVGKHYAKSSDDFEADAHFRESLREGLKYVCLNGPLQGFVTRFIAGANKPRKYKFEEAHVALVADWLPLLPVFLELADESFNTLVAKTRINTLADAGYPYDIMKCEEVEIKQNKDNKQVIRKFPLMSVIMQDAQRYWDACSSSDGSSLEKFYSSEPAMDLLKLKNKFEKVKMSDVHTKIRPYYADSAARATVWMAFWQRYGAALLDVVSLGRFMEASDLGEAEEPRVMPNGHTMNAVGMSWSDGGTDRVVNHMFHHYEEGMLITLQYTDDGWWSVSIGGRVFMCAPDVEQMDQSESVDFGKLAERVLYYQWEALSQAYSDTYVVEDFPPVFANALADNMRVLYTGKYLFCKYMVATHDGGARSGVAGITYANQVVAVFLAAQVQLAWDIAVLGDDYPDDAQSLEEWFLAFNNTLWEKYGLRYKPATLRWVEASLNQSIPEIVFLGMEIKYDDGHYYPVMPLEKIFASLWAPRPIVPPVEVHDKKMWQHRVQMERYRAYAIIGGYWYPRFHDLLQELFQYEIQVVNTFAVTDIIDVEAGLDEVFLLLPLINDYLRMLSQGKELLFPTIEWCKGIYNGQTRLSLVGLSAPKEAVWSERASDLGAAKQEVSKPTPVPKKFRQTLKNKPLAPLQVPTQDIPIEVGALADIDKERGLARQKLKGPALNEEKPAGSQPAAGAVAPVPKSEVKSEPTMADVLLIVQSMAQQLAELQVRERTEGTGDYSRATSRPWRSRGRGYGEGRGHMSDHDRYPSDRSRGRGPRRH